MKKDFLIFLNIAGAVSSILALMLTVAQNADLAFIIKALFSVLFFIAAFGTCLAIFKELCAKIIKRDYWPYYLLFWLVVGSLIIIISFIIASLGLLIITGFIQIGSGIVNDIKMI